MDTLPSALTPLNSRKIIHIDMDAFYASIEQRDNPELLGKPIAVGGSSSRGVVATASYEARKFGIHSAMPSALAARKCPMLIFVRPRFEVYQQVSRQVREIFADYTDLIEPLSLDEAYLDVTSNKKGIPSATLIAKEIRERIKEITKVTASAGISYCKFLAKIASDVNKPDGLTVITPEDAEAFIDELPIKKFHGIGKVTAAKMNDMGIETGSDLKKFTESDLRLRFGKAGRHYYRVVRGIDDRPVVSDRTRKSVGAENTFHDDLSTEEDMLEALDKIATKVIDRMERNNALGRTLTLKLKYHDFEQQTRSRTHHSYISLEKEKIMQLTKDLLNDPEFPDKPIRLLGLTFSNLNLESTPKEGEQLTLDF